MRGSSSIASPRRQDDDGTKVAFALACVEVGGQRETGFSRHPFAGSGLVLSRDKRAARGPDDEACRNDGNERKGVAEDFVRWVERG